MKVNERQITLTDGRQLGFAEYGDAQGRPVYYFHGWPGSRLEAHAMGPIASELGVRIIAVDRPGYGLSEFQPHRRIFDWPEDVVQLADSLKLDRFGVIGVSGGGPYALVCAARIPNRLNTATIVCGLGPLDAPEATRGMMRHNRFLLSLGRRAPWLARWLLGCAIWVVRHNPQLYLSPRLLTELPEPDRAALRYGEFRHMLFASTMEAFRQGTRGPFHDGRLYAQPWGFQLADITREILLWHGEQDVFVPVALGSHQAQLLPRCRARFLPDEGHLSLPLNHIREILALAIGDG
ncbi:MAG: alpha/beta hydrolase [Verrucomicrobia bacterium]|nr:alpha/beta hydrolase [Verrucomicrobiota bacterium]